MHFETPRLRIEPLRRGHARSLYPALLDPRIYAYIPENPPVSERALAARYATLQRGAPRGHDEVWLNWALRLRPTREAVGTLQATLFRDLSATIGYVLSSTYWNRGYATEACAWLVDYLTVDRGVVELRASVDVRNDASCRLLDKLGFARTGERVVEMHGALSTDYLYRLRVRGR